MPQQRSIKSNGYPYKETKRQERSAAWFKQLERKSNTAAELFTIQSRKLQAAAKRTKHTDELRKLTDSLIGQARTTAERADTRQASHDHNEAQLTRAVGARAELAVALNWIKASIGQLPDVDDRDRVLRDYAAQFQQKASKLRPPKP